MPAYLDTLLGCAPRYKVFSDLRETVGSQMIHDVFDELPSKTHDSYPEFDRHRLLKELQIQGKTDYEDLLHPHHPAKKENEPGWKLDKWKFLPLLEQAAKGKAKWYLFVEDDTHIIWSTLLLWLRQLNPNRTLWLGSPSCFGTHQFAQGGSGYVLSRPALLTVLQTILADYDKFEDVVAHDCCGDSALAKVMAAARIPLTKSWPFLKEESLWALDYQEKNYCQPLVSMHRMEPDDVRRVWTFEQEMLQKRTPAAGNGTVKHAILRKDIFNKFFSPMLLSGNGTQDQWDNLSRDETFTTPSQPITSEWCYQRCYERPACIQYAFTPSECRLNYILKLGSAIEGDTVEGNVTSGWMQERVKSFQARMEPCRPSWQMDDQVFCAGATNPIISSST